MQNLNAQEPTCCYNNMCMMNGNAVHAGSLLFLRFIAQNDIILNNVYDTHVSMYH